MSTERPYHFTDLLQVSKKSLWSLILYIFFFHDLIHVYSPRAGGIQPPRDKVFMSTETSFHFGHLLLVSSHRRQQFLKIHYFTFFPTQKHKGPNLTLPENMSRSTQHHHLNKFGSSRAPDTTYQVSRSSAFWFRRRNFLRFLPYMGMAAILVMWPGPFEQTFVPPSHGGSIWNLTLIGQAVSEEKMFKECGWWRTDNQPAYTTS